ncbi:kinase-like protein [Ceratobasidium sp. AG-I]|nr:kinase-like protein [Ceratobasidium sp. AG-I]
MPSAASLVLNDQLPTNSNTRPGSARTGVKSQSAKVVRKTKRELERELEHNEEIIENLLVHVRNSVVSPSTPFTPNVSACGATPTTGPSPSTVPTPNKHVKASVNKGNREIREWAKSIGDYRPPTPPFEHVFGQGSSDFSDPGEEELDICAEHSHSSIRLGEVCFAKPTQSKALAQLSMLRNKPPGVEKKARSRAQDLNDFDSDAPGDETDELLSERGVCESPSEKTLDHLASQHNASRTRRNNKKNTLVHCSSRAEFQITSETPLDAIINYLKSNSDLRDFTTDLEHADCSRYPIATGGLADIYRATLRNNFKVAIKRMRSNFVSEGKATKRTARELHTWSKLRHRNILEVLGLAVFGEKLAMVSPWMENGNIMQHLDNHPDLNRYAVVAQVVEAVVYLHEVGVVHGDIKGDNILVSGDGTLKLTDFGLTLMHEQMVRFSTTDAGGGTYRWMAPELIQGDGIRSKEADMCALGMTMLQIFTGRIPFHEIPNDAVLINEVLSYGRKPQCPVNLLDTCHGCVFWQVLERCWALKPETRITAKVTKDALSELLEV